MGDPVGVQVGEVGISEHPGAVKEEALQDLDLYHEDFGNGREWYLALGCLGRECCWTIQEIPRILGTDMSRQLKGVGLREEAVGDAG